MFIGEYINDPRTLDPTISTISTIIIDPSCTITDITIIFIAIIIQLSQSINTNLSILYLFP